MSSIYELNSLKEWCLEFNIIFVLNCCCALVNVDEPKVEIRGIMSKDDKSSFRALNVFYVLEFECRCINVCNWDIALSHKEADIFVLCECKKSLGALQGLK